MTLRLLGVSCSMNPKNPARQVYLRAHVTLRDDMADWAAAVAALVDASPDAPLALLRAFAGADEVPPADGEGGAAAWRPAPIAPHLAHSFLVKCDQVSAVALSARGLARLHHGMRVKSCPHLYSARSKG